MLVSNTTYISFPTIQETKSKNKKNIDCLAGYISSGVIDILVEMYVEQYILPIIKHRKQYTFALHDVLVETRLKYKVRGLLKDYT